MKRVKSCSTLRLKAHQLLNEEEKEILKYAIRNYRKNQSIDNLCDILTKIITDANRSCIISIIADMLKEEQRSVFLHRCYTKMPGYNISTQHLAKSDMVPSSDISNSNLSLKAATFVSKYRINNSHSTFRPELHNSISFQLDNSTEPTTLKSNLNHQTKAIENHLKSKFKAKRSDSDEILKSIEKSNMKTRPTLSSLQDKGFWYAGNSNNNNNNNNESATDDDSSLSHSSSQENRDHNTTFVNHISKKQISRNFRSQMSIDKIKEEGNSHMGKERSALKTKFSDSKGITPRFYSKNSALLNGEFSNQPLMIESEPNSASLPRPSRRRHENKFMICKLHFSTLNESEFVSESINEIPAYLQCLAGAILEFNNPNLFAVNFHLQIPTYLCSSTYCENNNSLSNKSQLTQYEIYQANKITCRQLQTNTDLLKNSVDNRKFFTDEGCQTSPVLTRDSTTQTFIC